MYQIGNTRLCYSHDDLLSGKRVFSRERGMLPIILELLFFRGFILKVTDFVLNNCISKKK